MGDSFFPLRKYWIRSSATLFDDEDSDDECDFEDEDSQTATLQQASRIKVISATTTTAPRHLSHRRSGSGSGSGSHNPMGVFVENSTNNLTLEHNNSNNSSSSVELTECAVSSDTDACRDHIPSSIEPECDADSDFMSTRSSRQLQNHHQQQNQQKDNYLQRRNQYQHQPQGERIPLLSSPDSSPQLGTTEILDDRQTESEMDDLLLSSSSEGLATRSSAKDSTRKRTLRRRFSFPSFSVAASKNALRAAASTPKLQAAKIEAPIIHAIDRLEDEMETHAYEELVPLEVKLALEDRVFGWSHLTSILLGHTAFTVGAYLLVFHAVTLIKVLVTRSPAAYQHPSDLSISFQVFRGALGVWAALSVYRMVRRRRQVWFRSAYGSKAYKRDEQRRRQSVRETDRTTALGRVLGRFRERRVYKRLRKAENQFAKKHAALQKEERLQRQKQDSSPRSVENRSRRRRPRNSSVDDTIVSNSSYSLSDITRNSSGASHMPENESNYPLLQRQEGSFDDETSSTDESESNEGDGRGVESHDDSYHLAPVRVDIPKRASFHTESTRVMQSVRHDQILFEKIRRMPYAHGGFFGAAPFMLGNPHWISILRHLMPDVYVEISRRAANRPAPSLIHWAENNPVVAAYGAAYELDQHSHIPNLEWDVFVDPALASRVEVVLAEKEKYLASLNGKSRDDSNQSWPAVSTSPKSSKHILAFFDAEVKKRSQQLVDKMLIAHGNMKHLVIEQTGFAKNYNYSRVKRTRRTLGGGIYARQWAAVFAEALKLGVQFDAGNLTPDPSDDEAANASSSSSSEDTEHQPRSRANTTSLAALARSKCPQTTIAESIRIVQSICKREKPIGLVLDLKSRHVSKRVWSIVVDTLRSSGVRVEGIASFSVEDIRGVKSLCTTGPVDEIIFFHSAGDLQQACHEGRIQNGDMVFFNGGSLLGLHEAYVGQHSNTSLVKRFVGPFDPNQVKSNYKILSHGLPSHRDDDADDGVIFSSSTIEAYKKRFNLSIGLYCQEFAIDEAAANMLAKLSNEHADIYDLGLSWGGVNGITIRGICPGRFTSTDGFWNQRYVGAVWDYSLSAQQLA